MLEEDVALDLHGPHGGQEGAVLAAGVLGGLDELAQGACLGRGGDYLVGHQQPVPAVVGAGARDDDDVDELRERGGEPVGRE